MSSFSAATTVPSGRAPMKPAPGTRLVCHTRHVKKLRHEAARGPMPLPSPAITVPLFSGTLHFVTVAFRTPGGVAGVTGPDTAVAATYAAAIAPIASRYASQYGPNALAVAPGAPSQTVTPSGGTTYSDAELAGWVDAFAAALALPAGDAVAVLNPPRGVENSDARVSAGVLGYHAISPGGHPYAFVNVRGSGLSIGDPEGSFALALSHEIQEMLVDPQANGSQPEVCDPCAGNCAASAALELFDASGVYLGATTTTTTAPPPGARCAFYLNSMVRRDHATDCPAPAPACAYPPP